MNWVEDNFVPEIRELLRSIFRDVVIPKTEENKKRYTKYRDRNTVIFLIGQKALHEFYGAIPSNIFNFYYINISITIQGNNIFLTPYWSEKTKEKDISSLPCTLTCE